MTNETAHLSKVDILGVNIANVSMSQALFLISGLLLEGKGAVLNFLNAHYANVSCTDSNYRSALIASDYIFGDGSGVKLASKLAGTPLIDNVNGTDLAPLLFQHLEKNGKSILFLGGKPGVAKLAAEKTASRYPAMVPPVFEHGFKNEKEWKTLAEMLAENPPDIMLVALGVPLQEKRINMLKTYLPNTLLIGVGGLIDFLAERIPRAPLWLRKLGLEWTFRLYQEPGRMWRRYLVGNVLFLLRTFWYLAVTKKRKEELCKL